MVVANDLFHDSLLAEVESILEMTSVHRARIFFRNITTERYSTTQSFRSITLESPSANGGAAYIRSENEEIFHIASLTKMLVAAAVVHASIKKEDDENDRRWSKFKGILKLPITHVINQNTEDEHRRLRDLPGAPSIEDLIYHSKGLLTINDLILAPDGTPLWTLQHVRNLQLLFPSGTQIPQTLGDLSRWTRYSNANYAIIALAIETLWDDTLDNFMRETLFKPLGMRSTWIGFPTDYQRPSSRWMVDEGGVRRQVRIPEYETDGAEAGALGCYSTAYDLDIFLSSMIRARHGEEPQAFVKTAELLELSQNKQTDEIIYTPFGLFTNLSSSAIGSLSLNHLQFPNELFTKYSVVPGSLGEAYPLHYMAGSAIGCCCATALRVDTKDNFALVVLTDTSGPVDAADHILRLILRHYVFLDQPRNKKRKRELRRLESIGKAVLKAKQRGVENWEAKKREDQDLKAKAPQVSWRLDGVFEGQGIHQKLDICKRDGVYWLTVIGPPSGPGTNSPARSGEFELFWINQQSLKLYIPPHMSIDILGDGDWSNLIFTVECEGDRVETLIRNGASGKYVYQRPNATSSIPYSQ